ncbi:hypothetical protein [Fodinicola feengrottensis]|uniref:hypothetical protein n=1 Tax=Fodinicola feengrottensis TaxID=435914 RepID=UPI0013D415A2|nr:hypothetical protein [Fodinicola feengrottensis]
MPDPAATNKASAARAWVKDFQARAERTPLGQGVISALVIFVVLVGIVWNLPDSPIRAIVVANLQPVANVAGLDQNWGVFAPNPPRQLTYLTVAVTTRSGRELTWRRPASDPVIRHYWVYRWRKLDENLARTDSIRKPFAQWVAGQLTTAADPPARVKITARLVPLLVPPGGGKIGPAQDLVLYDEVFNQK